MRRILILSLALVGTSSCLPGRRRHAPSDRSRITAEEISRTDAQNAYQAVANLRPTWLRSRGPVSVGDPSPTYPDVYLDGVSTGAGPDFLSGIHVSRIVEIHFYNTAQAGARFGMGHPRGVIDIVTVRDDGSAVSAPLRLAAPGAPA